VEGKTNERLFYPAMINNKYYQGMSLSVIYLKLTPYKKVSIIDILHGEALKNMGLYLVELKRFR
jgi:hypothetical protein